MTVACSPRHQPFSVEIHNSGKEPVTVSVRFDGYESGEMPLEPGMQKTEMGIHLPFPSELRVEVSRASGSQQIRLAVPPKPANFADFQKIVIEIDDVGASARIDL